jgi:predicted Zn-dependent protease
MAKSLKVMTAEEKNQIRKTVLHIVQAKKGETLEKLSKRTGNVLELDYVALINDLDMDETFTESKWIKIGLLKKY